MNQLRQLMLEELQRRNFAETTIRCYLHGVTHFSRYFRRPPDQLGPEDIRKYQAMLFTKLKYSPRTLTIAGHRVGHYSAQGKLLTPLTKKQVKAVENFPTATTTTTG